MNKIDARRHYLIVLDTETCNGLTEEGGQVNLTNSLVYDTGWQVVDIHGNVYEKRSFAIRELFVESGELMQSAYYADKIPSYWDDIWSGKRTIVSFMTMRKQLLQDMKNYGITEVSMHNARFDVNALNNTIRLLTGSKVRWFFPYGTRIIDTLKMARQVVAKKPTYVAFCKRNGYMTKHKTPQVRLTAEVLYRFISNNLDFEEAHQGLQDVEIETVIFTYCKRQHKKMDPYIF